LRDGGGSRWRSFHCVIELSLQRTENPPERFSRPDQHRLVVTRSVLTPSCRKHFSWLRHLVVCLLAKVFPVSTSQRAGQRGSPNDRPRKFSAKGSANVPKGLNLLSALYGRHPIQRIRETSV
jgi:hypothetical protein